MSKSDNKWIEKWQTLIDRIGQLIAKEGGKIGVINVQAQRNVKKQYEQYLFVCETVKNSPESVVTTSLPREERIFWPYKDVQFYIREGDERVHCTGNPDVLQQIFNIKEEPVRSDKGPYLEFWRTDKLIFQLDDFRYVDNTRLFDKDYKLDVPALLEKYQFHQSKELENKDNWYLLKFFFIASEFTNLEGTGDLIAGIPKGLKIKCECDELLDTRWNLKGFLYLSKFNFRYPYYLRISETCEKCGHTICIYRNKVMDTEGTFIPLRMFMNFLDPSWNYHVEDLEMVDAWQTIFREAVLKNKEAIQAVYGDDIIKLGMFLKRMEQKYSK